MSHEPTERLPGEAAAAKRHREILVGAGLAAFLVAPRSLFLGADPPTDFHYHFLTDEGGWAHNARLRELFGVWRLDDDAVPLHGAFLYTLALRGIYALFGVGLVQTRLLAVAGGLLTCALLYLFVRRQRSWPTAAVATLLFGASSFVSAHHRVAFVESFQLPFVAGLFFALALAARRWPWAIVAAVAWILACMAKVWALSLLAPAGLFWLACIWRERRLPWRPACAFAGTLALSGLLLLAAWGFDSAGLAESARDSWTEATRTSSTDLQPLSMGLLGLTKDVGGQLTPRRSDGTWKLGTVGPIRRSPLLFVLVGLLAALAVATADRHRWRGGPWLDPTRLLCWCWLLGGLVLVGLQEYQPDRRYLFLMLPVAILVADALMGPRGTSERYARSQAPPSEGLGVLLGGESPRRRRWTAALAFGLWIGLIARAPLAEWVEVAAAGISVGEHPGLTPRLAGALAWALTAGAVAALAAAFLPRVVSAFEQRIGTGDRRRRVVIALLLLLAAVQIVPFVQYLANPIYSVRDAARLLDAWSRDWPVDRRVMVGNHADTLALESRLLAVVIRPWRDSGFFMNEDGWSRFDPWVVQGREPPIPGFRRAGTLELGVGRIDAPHFRLAIYTREGIPPLPASAEPEGPDP